MHAICTADSMHPAAHLSILFAALRLIYNQLHSVLRLSPGPAGRDSSLSHCRLSIVAAARSASAHMRIQLSPATSSLLEICRAACCALLRWERLRDQAVCLSSCEHALCSIDSGSSLLGLAQKHGHLLALPLGAQVCAQLQGSTAVSRKQSMIQCGA